MRYLLVILCSLAFSVGLNAQTSVPDTLKTVTERADYVVGHYWENFNFRDTTLLTADVAEQRFVDFVVLLPYASAQGRATAIDRWWDRVGESPQAEDYFYDLATDYLHGTSSPQRNDSLYLSVLRRVTLSPRQDVSSRAAHRLRQLSLNAVGTTAADFTMQVVAGAANSAIATIGQAGATTSCRLSQLLRGRPMAVLFYDPDCRECQMALFRLRHSSLLRRQVDDGRLDVLTVCVGEADDAEALCRHATADLPASWRHAYVGMALVDSLYDLSTLPLLFLLDTDGRVVLRDVPADVLLQYLNRQ